MFSLLIISVFSYLLFKLYLASAVKLFSKLKFFFFTSARFLKLFKKIKRTPDSKIVPIKLLLFIRIIRQFLLKIYCFRSYVLRTSKKYNFNIITFWKCTTPLNCKYFRKCYRNILKFKFSWTENNMINYFQNQNFRIVLERSNHILHSVSSESIMKE